MDVGELVEKNLTRCEEVRRFHQEYDVDLMDLDYVWEILRGLPQDWSLVIMSLQPDQCEWALDNIISFIRQEELRRTKIAGESPLFVKQSGGRPTDVKGNGKVNVQGCNPLQQVGRKETRPNPRNHNTIASCVPHFQTN